MATVYLLCGEFYEDSPTHDRIIGVFSSQEIAESVACGNKTYDVLEYEIDYLADCRRGPTYYASIQKSDGRIVGNQQDYDGVRHTVEPVVIEGPLFFLIRSPISAEHALLIAQEKYQEWLKTQEPSA